MCNNFWWIIILWYFLSGNGNGCGCQNQCDDQNWSGQSCGCQNDYNRQNDCGCQNDCDTVRVVRGCGC